MLTSAGPCDSPAVVKRSMRLSKYVSPTGGSGSRGVQDGCGREVRTRSRNRQNVAGPDIDDDQSFRRQPEQLENDGRIVVREAVCHPNRSVQIGANRQDAAAREVEGVEDLYRAVRR